MDHLHPQIKYKRAKHRLTHPVFLMRYRKFLKPGGTITKCDSEYLHGYTHGIVQMLGLEVEEAYHNIHEQILPKEGILFDVVTHYESMWLAQGKATTYLRFKLDGIEEAIAHWDNLRNRWPASSLTESTASSALYPRAREHLWSHRFLGTGRSARVVGYAMNASHNDPTVPAHRVVNRKGLLTGKHFFGGSTVMEDLLPARASPS